ncbi:MAG: multiheme c-type cytochrome [Candidatus Anammoxibacter sp.]
MYKDVAKKCGLIGGVVVLAVGFIFSSNVAFAKKAKQYKYLGAGGCKCHMNKTVEANEYKKVGYDEKVGHFNTFKRLETDEDKKNPECLSCHATAYGKKIKKGKSKFGNFIENVTCEACHGAGDGYVKVKKNYKGKGKDAFQKLMKADPLEARKAQFDAGGRIAGVNKPTTVKAQCLECHWEDAGAKRKCPKTDKLFKFKEYFKIDDHRDEDHIDKVIAKLSDAEKKKYKGLIAQDPILYSPYKK